MRRGTIDPYLARRNTVLSVRNPDEEEEEEDLHHPYSRASRFFATSGSTNSDHSNPFMASSPEISEENTSGGASHGHFTSPSPLSSGGHTPLLPTTTPTYLPPAPPPQVTPYPAIRPPGRPISTISEAPTLGMDEETLDSEEDHPGESTDLSPRGFVHDLTTGTPTHELDWVGFH